MRIAHVIGGGERGGARAHLTTLCRWLPQYVTGVEVELVCLMDGPVAEAARRHDIPLEILPMRSAMDVGVIRTLRDHLQRTAATIVHTHGVRANFVGRLAARGLGVPIVTTVHSSMYGDYARSSKRWLYPPIERLTRGYTDRFIAVASSLKDELERDGIARDRVSVVYNCVPDSDPTASPAPASLRAQLGLDESVPIVMSVGRLEAVKDPRALLDVFSLLAAKARFHGVIVGDGSLGDALRRCANAMGLARDVSFLGFRDDVPWLLRQADVVASTSAMEGLPVAVLETMRAQKPVVVSAVGGLAEVVALARNGFAVAPGDLQTYADCIERLLGDPELAARLARNGTEALERWFSLDAFLRGNQEVYDAVESQRGRSSTGAPGVRRPRVTIAGYYGAGNTGDEAILAGMLRILRDEGISDVTVLSFDPDATERVHHVDALYIGKRFTGIAELARHLRRSDLFVLGGGGLFQDGLLRVVPFWASRVALALLERVPVVYCAIGVGPLSTRPGRWLTRSVSNRATAITVRDHASAALLRDCGVRRPDIEVTADAALCLPVTSSGRDRPAAAESDVVGSAGRPSIAVCIRPWESPLPLAPALAECLGALQRRRAIRYVFFPLHDREDRHISEAVVERLASDGAAPASRVLHLPQEPQRTAAMLAEMDGVIAMRLHGVILAALGGVPVFGLAYDPKVVHFMERLGIAADTVTLGDLCLRTRSVVERLDSWIAEWALLRERMGSVVDGSIVDAQRNARMLERVANSRAGRGEPGVE